MFSVALLVWVPACASGIISNGTAIGDINGGTVVPAPSPLLIDDFTTAYVNGGVNNLGLAHSDTGALQSVSTSRGALSIVTGANANTATWNTAVGTPCFDANGYTGVAFTLQAPAHTALTVRLITRDASCGNVTLTQDVQIPFTSLDGSAHAVVIDFSHDAAVEISDVTALTLTGFSDNVTYTIGAISFLGGLADQSIAPPNTGVTLDLPDPNFGDGAADDDTAQWAYDAGSLAGLQGLGTPPYDAANPAWPILQQYITAGDGAWDHTLAITNRPYAMSGQSGATAGDGDRFKLRSVQAFGAGTFTWRVYTPLFANSVGGERTSTAAWILCESCTGHAAVPEVDFECGYADSTPGAGVRATVAANANQTVCQMTIVDGSASGATANPMAVAGDAWHVFSMNLADNGQGTYALSMAIDGNTVTWPDTVSVDPNQVDLGADANRWSTTGGYTTDVRFNAMISVEHLNWMGSQNAASYNTAYFDWFNYAP